MCRRQGTKGCKNLVWVVTAVLLVMLGAAHDLSAQVFPSKTVTIIVPWAAGGTSDASARVLAKHLSDIWGQPVIVVNQPGATGVIGSLKLAGSDPDGYTLGFLSTAVQTTQYTSPNPTDRNAFSYVMGVYFEPFTMTVKGDAPWRSLKEFVDYVKANPGKVTHSSSGASSTDKMVAMAFAKRAGIQLPDVPFEGYAPAVTAVLSGKIQSTSATPGNIAPYLKGGELRILALTSEKRLAEFPNIPTFAESGINLSWVNWNGILGPKGIPPERMAAIQTAVEKVYAMKAWQEYMAKSYIYIFPVKGDQFKAQVDKSDPFLKEMIEAAGLMKTK
jgi:tripartite-type tricarboxylate transporter receptor subunit TctC